MMRTGGCQCGTIRYQAPDRPTGLWVCHCLECRHQSASAFGLSYTVPRAGFRLTQGRPKRWSRDKAGGGRLDCWFCPDCGSRVWHETPGEDTVTVKAGSLDDPPDLGGAVHIWTRRKLPGVVIPDGAETFPGEPGSSAQAGTHGSSDLEP